MKRIFVTLCIIYSVFSILWNYVLDSFSRLILIPIGLVILPILGFYIKAVVSYSLKKHAIEHKKEVQKEKKYNRKMQKDEFLREYDAKIKPLHAEARDLFALLMKQRKVHSYEIQDLISILNDRLGKHLNHYHNYEFKNDVHEIYVKMKNFHLNEYDWEVILNFIHTLEDNEPIKRERKTKEVITK